MPFAPDSQPTPLYTVRSMALNELVRYVARCCASRLHPCDMYEMAEKCDWSAGRVKAFLRYQAPPTEKMLGDMARELGIPLSELMRILER